MTAAMATLLLVLSTPALVVEGDTTCPPPDAVEAELVKMLGSLEAIGERVRLLTGPAGSVVVELRDPAGEPKVLRQIGAEVSCRDRPQVVAVSVAVRLNEVHPELVIAWPPIDGGEGPPPPPPPGPPARGHRLDAGAGLAATLAGTEPALGLFAQLNLVPAVSGLGGHLGLAADLARSATFEGLPGDVSVDWRRIPLGIGPLWRVTFGGYHLDTRATLLASWLTVQRPDPADALESAQAQSDFALGAGAGLRLLGREGPLLKWLDVSAAWWPSQAASLSQGALQAPLPQVHLMLTLGASWCGRCRATKL